MFAAVRPAPTALWRLTKTDDDAGGQAPSFQVRDGAEAFVAGFVTFAHVRGTSDRAIAHQTRHASLATAGNNTRVEDAWIDNAATQLGIWGRASGADPT